MRIRSVRYFRPRRVVAALFACAVLACALAGTANADPSADVIGGTSVSHSDYTTTYPFTVGLLAAKSPNTQFCGGTLISPRWVMTAAHCYSPDEGADPLFIRIGSEDRLTGGEYVPVVAHYIHPEWDAGFLSNDIMLLKLEYAPTPANPAQRATAIDDPTDGQLATVIGWGLTEPGDDAFSSRFLQLATLDVINQTECEDRWEELEGVDFVTSNQICAIHYDPGDAQRSACNGDSGGPLLFGNKVVGIVSFGYFGCFDEAPNVFTRVSAYNGWIDAVRMKSLTVPSALSFGATDATRGSLDRTIKIDSDGDGPINIIGLQASGDFAVKSSTCLGPIQPAIDCFITVTFDPKGLGKRLGELVLTTDSLGDPVKRITFDGFGTQRESFPVSLKISIPRKSKPASGKLTTKFKVSFRPPSAANTPEACAGRVKLSLRIPKVKRAVKKSGTMSWSSKGCAVTLKTRLPKKAKGKWADATVTIPGNYDVTATKLEKPIKIR